MAEGLTIVVILWASAGGRELNHVYIHILVYNLCRTLRAGKISAFLIHWSDVV